MKKYYSLTVNSKNDKDIPIAMRGKKDIICLHENDKPVKSAQSVHSDKYDILPIPYIKDDAANLRYFIAGSSGAGKSTLAAKIAEQYVKFYPDQKVYIISAVDHDPAYDDNPKLRGSIERIDIHSGIEDLNVEDFQNSLCIFDDASISSPTEQKLLNKMKDMILSYGRHHHIDSMIVRQNFLGNKETKMDHLQSQYIVFFPNVGNDEEIFYMFDKKYHLGKPKIQKLLGGSSRWVLLHKHHPHYTIESNKVEII